MQHRESFLDLRLTPSEFNFQSEHGCRVNKPNSSYPSPFLTANRQLAASLIILADSTLLHLSSWRGWPSRHGAIPIAWQPHLRGSSVKNALLKNQWKHHLQVQSHWVTIMVLNTLHTDACPCSLWRKLILLWWQCSRSAFAALDVIKYHYNYRELIERTRANPLLWSQCWRSAFAALDVIKYHYNYRELIERTRANRLLWSQCWRSAFATLHANYKGSFMAQDGQAPQVGSFDFWVGILWPLFRTFRSELDGLGSAAGLRLWLRPACHNLVSSSLEPWHVLWQRLRRELCQKCSNSRFFSGGIPVPALFGSGLSLGNGWPIERYCHLQAAGVHIQETSNLCTGERQGSGKPTPWNPFRDHEVPTWFEDHGSPSVHCPLGMPECQKLWFAIEPGAGRSGGPNEWIQDCGVCLASCCPVAVKMYQFLNFESFFWWGEIALW